MDGTNTPEMDIELPIFVPTKCIQVQKQCNICSAFSLLRLIRMSAMEHDTFSYKEEKSESN